MLLTKVSTSDIFTIFKDHPAGSYVNPVGNPRCPAAISTPDWATQQKLQSAHPDMYNEFLNGHFAVRRTAGTFNMLPSDQVIEQTINKEQKGAGGIIGISTSTGAVQRWVLLSHIIAGLLTSFRNSLCMSQSTSKPKDFGRSRMKIDESAVEKC